jgi:hypothetical protein
LVAAGDGWMDEAKGREIKGGIYRAHMKKLAKQQSDLEIYI